jgi:hypothetical protein
MDIIIKALEKIEKQVDTAHMELLEVISQVLDLAKSQADTSQKNTGEEFVAMNPEMEKSYHSDDEEMDKWDNLEKKCWVGYRQDGMKEKSGRMVPNCVPVKKIDDLEKATSVRVGQMVSWNSSGGTARGKVISVARSGSINVPNSDFTINATEESPAALIRIYRDGKPTDTIVGHKVDTLRVSSLKSEDGVVGNDDVPNKMAHSMEDCKDANCPEHYMGKKDYSDKERQALARRDMALPDGSFPIVTASDLQNAIQSVGRSSNYAKARNHIIRRAEALNRLDMLPEEWKPMSDKKSSNVEKRSVADIDLTPTDSMRANAKRGLELRQKFGRGGTAVGVARARDLTNGRDMSPETVARMYSFFSRHEVDKQGKDWDNSERPSNGKIAWLLWGGDSGFSWSTQKWEAIKNIRDNKSDDMWKDSAFYFHK